MTPFSCPRCQYPFMAEAEFDFDDDEFDYWCCLGCQHMFTSPKEEWHYGETYNQARPEIVA
jgi:hypothetical protein